MRLSETKKNHTYVKQFKFSLEVFILQSNKIIIPVNHNNYICSCQHGIYSMLRLYLSWKNANYTKFRTGAVVRYHGN